MEQVLADIGLSSAAVFAAVWFVVWRFQRARRLYLRKAEEDADRLVKPGSIFGDVVGRDQLCDALMSDLRDRERRRPHVIMGAIGLGKTAVLVRLTEMLARKGAVPVVLPLQDLKVEGELDFTALARKQFLEEVREWVSPAEAEKVWQRLRYRNDSIVVLADGLEDALSGEPDRANKIRKAIADAEEARLPLVMASRPQESLLAMRAANTVLEPLGEEPALRYIAENSGWRSDKRLLDWVVEAANVAESPLYLNIAKDLETRSRLEPVVGGGGDELADPRDQDEWVLRYDLMDAWINALVDGALYPEQPISYEGRRLTVEYLSALACVALTGDSATAAYEVLERPEDERLDTGYDRALRELFLEKIRGRRNKDNLEARIDVRLAGSWGSRLGLVEEQGNGVRFRHSVLLAYLASRYLGTLVRAEPGPDGWDSWDIDLEIGQEWRDSGMLRRSILHEHLSSEPTELTVLDKDRKDAARRYFKDAAERGSRELNMALIFYSRSPDALSGCTHGIPHQGEAREDRPCPITVIREKLREAVRGLLKRCTEGESGADRLADDVEQDPRIQALEMYSTVLDIDSFHHEPEHREILEEIRGHWLGFQEYNQRKLEFTKMALIKRIGATARLISGRIKFPPELPIETGHGKKFTAYDHMFTMACLERSYQVQFAFAREIGQGGGDAFDAIWPPDGRRPEPIGDAKFKIANGITEFIRNPVPPKQNRSGSAGTAQKVSAPGSGPDDEHPVPGTTRTERLLRKNRQQRVHEEQRRQEKQAQQEQEGGEREWRANFMQAWLAPMLVRSCGLANHKDTPYELLRHWMTEKDHDLALEVALAQGFKHAANHRALPTEPSTARDFLSEQAEEMLKRTHFWFAQLTLIHALALWAIPDDVTQRRPRYGHGANPRKQVKRWLEWTDHDGRERAARREHPLVRAAGKLALRALETRRPDRFLWIDEASVAGQIGSEIMTLGEPRRHNLWIPPSMGWSSLDPRAQQLLADVLVLLILTEQRGDRVADEKRRLDRVNRSVPPMLPPCLTRDRSPLEPMLTHVRATPQSVLGSMAGSAPFLPGSNCADGCPFELCPYPPKGPECRTELNELFCIHQRIKLNVWQPKSWLFLRFRRRPPWQRHVSVANLRRFWDEMGARARDRTQKEAFSLPRSRR